MKLEAVGTDDYRARQSTSRLPLDPDPTVLHGGNTVASGLGG